MLAKSSLLPVLALLVLQLLSQVDAHSRMLEPRVRVGGFLPATDPNVLPAACGGGKQGARPQDVTYRRGQTIPVVWPRNNHPAGFVRLSIVPFNSAQSIQDFDNGVVQFSCHEAGCRAGNPADPLGEDNTPIDGNRCSTQLKLPSYLPDGQYTLQWTWFGGASFFGDRQRGLTDWFGCHDFTLAGGDPVNPNSKPKCPDFIPGDAHNPASAGRCKFFGTGETLACRPDGCRGAYRDGIPAALERCRAANGNGGGGSNLAPVDPAPAPRPPTPQPRPPTPAPAPAPAPPANGNNNNGNCGLQTYRKAVAGVSAPNVCSVGGAVPFRVVLGDGRVSGTFQAVRAARMHSCDVFHLACVDKVKRGQAQGVSVAECDKNHAACKAAA
ncbi:hypothetical protein BCR44DRAFT_23586 [Catenaria anguillulae PL171]|uniref:Chitin-binding type-4 domain-containing protein n=1 Tax=Catenaria anguillulae PL171 TaxID=765915 RepID=A0A1Y2HN69_9FUNG|nr:hypothetical protein BCR44DRAFT_23586 [Catenaria anguillulae PL171]